MKIVTWYAKLNTFLIKLHTFLIIVTSLSGSRSHRRPARPALRRQSDLRARDCGRGHRHRPSCEWQGGGAVSCRSSVGSGPIVRSWLVTSRRSLSVSRHCSLHRRTATVTAISPPLDYEGSSHIATQSERAAEFPFSISGRPLCSASLLVLSSLPLPALLLSLVSCCVVLCGCSFRPFRRSLLRHCASSLLCAASLALSLRSGVGAVVGMEATARTGAVVLGCCGCFATALFFVVLWI